MVKKELLNKVFKEVELAENEIIETTARLVQFRSVNAVLALDKTKSEEKACQEFMAKELKDIGMKVNLWEHDPRQLVKYGRRYYLNPRESYKDRPNVVGVLKGTGKGNSLILAGHTDVVPADPEDLWKFDPWKPEIVDGKMYGRGAADMKSGMSAIIYAIECINRAGVHIKGDVQVHSVIDEEAGNLGALCVLDKGYTAEACIIPEPTYLGIQPKHKGILWLRVEIRGRSGHAQMAQSHWKEGGAVSAIRKALYAIQNLERLNEEWGGHGGTLPRPDKIDPDALLSTPAICVGVIRGGTNPHIIPEECNFRADIQYLPQEADEEGMGSRVQIEIEDYLKQAFRADPWLEANPPKIIWESDAEAAAIPIDHTFLKTVIDSVTEADQKASLTGLVSCCDMNKYVNVGHIPTVIYGPGHMNQAHAVDEYVELDKILAATKSLTALILNHCGYEN